MSDRIATLSAFRHGMGYAMGSDRPITELHAEWLERFLRDGDPEAVRMLDPLPNDHRLPGHVHRATYAGDGCNLCDEIFLAQRVK